MLGPIVSMDSLAITNALHVCVWALVRSTIIITNTLEEKAKDMRQINKKIGYWRWLVCVDAVDFYLGFVGFKSIIIINNKVWCAGRNNAFITDISQCQAKWTLNKKGKFWD